MNVKTAYEQQKMKQDFPFAVVKKKDVNSFSHLVARFTDRLEAEIFAEMMNARQYLYQYMVLDQRPA